MNWEMSNNVNCLNNSDYFVKIEIYSALYVSMYCSF